jgi:hypothetical protein
MKKCSFNSKNFIAVSITILSAIVTIFVICVALGQKEFEFIASSLFPLIGTWMGAIIAYYFAKENFDAAASQYNKVIDKLTPEQQLGSISVSSAMKLIKNAQVIQYDEFADKSVYTDLLNNPNMNSFNRYMFLKNNKCQYILHRSTLDRALTQHVSVANSKPEDLKLKDVINSTDEHIKGYVEKGIEFISLDANLLDAKNLIIKNKYCLDIIVTLNGVKGEDALGWITDVIISEKVKN